MRLTAALAAILLISAHYGPVHGQNVYIPDPTMRVWLNAHVAGVVDANGFMNTSAPAIAGFTNGELTCTVSNGPFDLTGLQYLNALTDLSLRVFTDVSVIPGLPASLTHLDALLYGTAILPSLPQGLQALAIASYDFNTIPALPNSLEHLELEGILLNNDLVELPSGLLVLDLHDLPLLHHLPELPVSLRRLHLTALDSITSIPPLPEDLDTLIIQSIPELSIVPPLPQGLIQFHCLRPAPSATIPELPASLRDLALFDVHGETECPALPNGLISLSINTVPFGLPAQLPPALQNIYARVPCTSVQVPALPPGLRTLFLAEHWTVSELPSLPDGLEKLFLTGFPELESLPALPLSLTDLRLQGCPNVTCLPPIPNGLLDLYISECSISCLPNELEPWTTATLDFDDGTICPDPCQNTGPVAAGHVFHDIDLNGSLDTSDHALVNAMVTTVDGMYLSAVDGSGHFHMSLPLGTHTLTSNVATSYPYSCSPAQHILQFTSAADKDTTIEFAVALEPGHHDLIADVSGNEPRPGSINSLWLRITIIGTEPQTGEAFLSFSTSQELSSVTPTPEYVDDSTISWEFGELLPGEVWYGKVNMNTPSSVVTGTTITHSFQVIPASPDETPSNNQFTLTQQVTEGMTPNEKVVIPSYLSMDQLANGERLTYTIRFQNTDQSSVQRVRIMDNLDQRLQWPSFRFVGSSHPCHWTVLGGSVFFDLPSINLPDSGSNQAASFGYVQFDILADTSISPGSVIPNTAAVYFDLEPAIITNTAYVGIETFSYVMEPATPKPGMLLTPNPAHDRLLVGVPVASDGIGRTEIFSTSGELLLERWGRTSGAWIDISALAPGTYVVRFVEAQGTWTSMLVVN